MNKLLYLTILAAVTAIPSLSQTKTQAKKAILAKIKSKPHQRRELSVGDYILAVQKAQEEEAHKAGYCSRKEYDEDHSPDTGLKLMLPLPATANYDKEK